MTRTPWGNVGRLVRGKDGSLYAIPRKDYVRTHAYPEHIDHFSSLPREKAAIIKLRNFGHNIHNIAQGLGRSTSYIHAILSKAKLFGAVRRFDNRKIPRRTKLLLSIRKLKTCLFYVQQWTAWILGEEGEPP